MNITRTITRDLPRIPTHGLFYIRTNSGGRTFRMANVPVSDPRREFWREVDPQSPEVMVAAAQVFQTHLVLFEREDGLPYLRIVVWQRTLQTCWQHPIALNLTNPPTTLPSVKIRSSAPSTCDFQYESFVTPRSIYDYEVRTRERSLRKRQPVLGGYDPAQYVSERLHATASDGTRVPLPSCTAAIRRAMAPRHCFSTVRKLWNLRGPSISVQIA